jgi:hypothetical protein
MTVTVTVTTRKTPTEDRPGGMIRDCDRDHEHEPDHDGDRDRDRNRNRDRDDLGCDRDHEHEPDHDRDLDISPRLCIYIYIYIYTYVYMYVTWHNYLCLRIVLRAERTLCRPLFSFMILIIIYEGRAQAGTTHTFSLRMRC